MGKDNKTKGKFYFLRGGSIASQFTLLYQIEVDAFGSRVKSSEAFICFPLLILQKDKNIKKTKDIRSLLKRRMQMWNEGLFEELVSEAERCDRNYQILLVKWMMIKKLKIFQV